jgi:hypothetical protein
LTSKPLPHYLGGSFAIESEAFVASRIFLKGYPIILFVPFPPEQAMPPGFGPGGPQ